MLISKVIHLSSRHYPFNFCGSPSRKILMVDDPRKVKNKYFHGEYKILSNNEFDHLQLDKKNTRQKKDAYSLHQNTNDIILSIPSGIEIFPVFLQSSHTLLYVANKKYIIETYNFEVATKGGTHYHNKVKSQILKTYRIQAILVTFVNSFDLIKDSYFHFSKRHNMRKKHFPYHPS